MSKYLISLCLTCLICLPLYAPMCEITLAEKFCFEVRGELWEQLNAMDGFEKWPGHYGHTQKEIWDIVKKESHFLVKAKSKRGAMGLMQNTRSAIRSIDGGQRYYRFRIDKNGRKEWIMEKTRSGRMVHSLHTKRIYTPSENLMIGCAYLRICKDMARKKGPQILGRITISTNELKDIFFVAGIGNYERCIKVALLYMQNTNQQVEGGEL